MLSTQTETMEVLPAGPVIIPPLNAGKRLVVDTRLGGHIVIGNRFPDQTVDAAWTVGHNTTIPKISTGPADAHLTIATDQDIITGIITGTGKNYVEIREGTVQLKLGTGQNNVYVTGGKSVVNTEKKGQDFITVIGGDVEIEGYNPNLGLSIMAAENTSSNNSAIRVTVKNPPKNLNFSLDIVDDKPHVVLTPHIVYQTTPTGLELLITGSATTSLAIRVALGGIRVADLSNISMNGKLLRDSAHPAKSSQEQEQQQQHTQISMLWLQKQGWRQN